jgi:4-hydroxy-tetrahydrodipicolinate reductase
MMLDISLIGYGKMGRMLHELASSHGCRVQSIVDPLQEGCLKEIDGKQLAAVCIDFSHPSAVLDNLRKLAAAKRDIVVGTTGWNDHLDEVRALAEDNGVGILWGANFSIGMNIFNRVTQFAAALCDKFPQYDIYGFELHHNQKADSPSGTAIQLAQTILGQSSRKTKAVYDKLDRRIEPDELHFASVRAGSIPGTHTVGFDSLSDTIELIHRVRSRACFAQGALEAAKWIAGRKGLYSFNQMMEERLC